MVELVMSIGLLAVLLGTANLLFRSFGGLNENQLRHQQGLAVCMAQLDSLTATGQAVEPSTVERLWPGWQVVIERQSGQGDWEGLTLINVEAQRSVRSGRPVQVRLARYMLLTGDTP